MRLLHHESNCIFSYSIPIATFSCKHSLGAKTVPLSSTALKIPNFPFLDFYAVHENGLFSGPLYPVRLLHGESDCIFRFSIPLLPFDVNTVLVQRRYHWLRQPRRFPNFHSWAFTPCIKMDYLLGRNAQCVYCTEKAIAFLGSPYP